MQVDYEVAWLDLKAHILGKRSHGTRDLIEAMAAIELENRVPEGQEGFDDLGKYVKNGAKPATAQPC